MASLKCQGLNKCNDGVQAVEVSMKGGVKVKKKKQEFTRRNRMARGRHEASSMCVR